VAIAPRPKLAFSAPSPSPRERSAKLWELRATTSLARLWADQGKRAEASDLLVPIYGWFTEGFDSADLQDAKALLEELT
jgi:predicted ATPase